jgi:hypothetical protein
VFATTHWSEVVNAGDSATPRTALALERLCQSYFLLGELILEIDVNIAGHHRLP